MEFTNRNTDLMYGALEVFLETDSPVLVGREGDNIEFSTLLGNHGTVVRNEDNEWDILIDDDVVYTMEDEVFNLINRENTAPDIDDLLVELSDLYGKDLRDKSKILLKTIIQGLGYLITNGKAKSGMDLQFGPHFVKSDSDNPDINYN